VQVEDRGRVCGPAQTHAIAFGHPERAQVLGDLAAFEVQLEDLLRRRLWLQVGAARRGGRNEARDDDGRERDDAAAAAQPDHRAALPTSPIRLTLQSAP
jgi:hypothetical protein